MTASFKPLQGLVAATFTPLHDDGSLNLATIPAVVEHLLAQQVAALYVLGSTGEGPSLTFEERCRVAEEYVRAAGGRLPVIIQVGSESLRQSHQLSAHAQHIGADGISAVSPVYFKPDSVESLVASMAEVASGAPNLPFYYYHIPTVTGVAISALEFLRLAAQRIPTLRGMKFTSQNVFEFQTCVEEAGQRFELLWGFDEMLQCGLAAGARAAVGSTYNFAAPIYRQMLTAFAAGDWEQVRIAQSHSQAIVRAFLPYGPRGAQKAIMKMIGIDCGPARLPVSTLTEQQFTSLKNDLEKIGFFQWIA